MQRLTDEEVAQVVAYRLGAYPKAFEIPPDWRELWDRAVASGQLMRAVHSSGVLWPGLWNLRLDGRQHTQTAGVIAMIRHLNAHRDLLR